MKTPARRVGWALGAFTVLVVGYGLWQASQQESLPAHIASGNGRIEATEIDISARAPGRIHEILVREGDFVKIGQILACMDTAQLEAERRQAEAQLRRVTIGVDAARSVLKQREAERTAAAAVVLQREAELGAIQGRLDRSEKLGASQVLSQQTLDDDRAAAAAARAAVNVAQAQVAAVEAGIASARALIIDAEAGVDAAKAVIARITADIEDCDLTSPRDGRVQYLVAQPGEVVGAGGRVLDLVDLNDVYMTFFLPTEQAGRIRMGAEARIALDAAPDRLIPARVTYVSDVAQFTPKTVETAAEREKLMFRIKANIDPALLRKYMDQVKTGLPGVAYVLLAPDAGWPAHLSKGLLP